jgi:hypothetical protein
MFKKKVPKLLSVIVAVSLITSIFWVAVYAIAPSRNQVVGAGIYPGAPAYTVWKDGSWYYAKDAYGVMVSGYSSGSLSASDIIQACVNNLGTTAGEIAICEGDFYCPATIYIAGKTIHFKGAGQGDFNKGGTFLTFANGVNGFEINSPGNSYTPSVAIEGMLIRVPSPSYGGTAIKSKGQYLTIRDVAIERFVAGISLEKTGYIDASAGDSLIENTVVRNCTYAGIWITSNDNRMSNVIVHYCQQGLLLNGESGGLNAVNVHLWGNMDNGLKIQKSQYDYFVNLQCEGNAGWGVLIGSLTGNVKSIKFMNSFFWNNIRVYSSYLGALSFAGNGDNTVSNVQIIGGQIGIAERAGLMQKGTGVSNTFIRMVNLINVTNNGFSHGSSTSDIYLCQGYT